MVVEVKPWDAAEVLDSEEVIAAYLEEAFAGGEPALIAAAIGAVARARNVSALSRETGLTREAIYKAFSAEGNPTLATMTSVMKALGYQLSVKPLTGREAA